MNTGLPHRIFWGSSIPLRGEFDKAIAAFAKVVKSKARDSKQEEIRALAFLGLGRLYYEKQSYQQAIKAYQSVDRNSLHFDSALYEIAWVHISLGDSIRAERSLEVLAMASPESRFIPDAKVLRANLLLRNGQFDQATEGFENVANLMAPINTRLAEVVKNHEDMHTYFKGLVQNSDELFDLYAFVPQEALQWAEPAENMTHAMALTEDMGETRKALRELDQLAARVQQALQAQNRVNLFTDLRLRSEQATLLQNRLAVARDRLISSQEGKGSGNAELLQIRSERKKLDALLRDLPKSSEEIAARDSRVQERYNALFREMKTLEVELLGVDARIVALEKFSKDHPELSASSDSGQQNALIAEVNRQKDAAQRYRQEIEQLRLVTEQAKLRIGVGDELYRRDQELRERYSELVRRESQLLASIARNYDPRVINMLSQAENVEKTLKDSQQLLEDSASERAVTMLRELDEELTKLAGYKQQVDVLALESEDVIADVAIADFERLRTRYYQLAVKAEVGRVDVAWARREEHRTRIEALSKDRARELQALDDEFQEVMDEKSFAEAEGDQ
ncbi:MAG: tetratricopeptide repeat protein [Myxococcales bacterium]|nr:MAG: tetratricopeptide repeat protein [Myxococcales bacterium]